MAVNERTEKSSVANLDKGKIGRIALLVAGDIAVFLLFAFVGRRSHSEDNQVLSVILTALPFAAGWLLVAPFLGAYRRSLDERSSRMAVRTLLAWIAAWPVGLLLRGLIEWRMPQLSFALVTLTFNAAFLLVWRSIYVVLKLLLRR